jgi:hypothetical protein
MTDVQWVFHVLLSFFIVFNAVRAANYIVNDWGRQRAFMRDIRRKTKRIERDNAKIEMFTSLMRLGVIEREYREIAHAKILIAQCMEFLP